MKIWRENHEGCKGSDGESCRLCGDDATHRVASDDDISVVSHSWTAYLCCGCFQALFGSWTHFHD